jgi:hypothetical protein
MAVSEHSNCDSPRLSQGQHVAGLLPILLPTNQLTINVIADVAGFPDLYINIIGS